jgi:CDP-diacylglycerol--glycerol-3-phosphate 3-phosphatidyltransferase
MIDELYKDKLDLLWDKLGRIVARTGLTPNGVTLIAFLLCGVNALAFTRHRDMLVFGILVAGIELLDNVDGAVARVTGTSSLTGAYLDATTDRYKDFFILLAVAWVTGYWLACMFAVAGSLITSYVHARAAMLGASDEPGGGGLPDLFERFERIATLSIGLVLTAYVPLIWGHDLIWWVVWGVALMSQVTGAQRFVRRLGQLRALDAATND